MLTKDRRRALRRWRSYYTWMRRLRLDWNDHGWKRDPVYEHGWVAGEWTVSGIRGTTLCGCFDLLSKQALRFKDTPSGNHSKRSCGCNDPMLEYKEEIKLEVGRECWGKPKRRKGPRKVREQCSRCGFLLGWLWLEAGESRRHGDLCEGCSRIMAERETYWFNGCFYERNILKEPA